MDQKRITRRAFIKTGAAAIGGTALMGGFSPNPVLGQSPIKVGVVLPLTGPMSGIGTMMKEGLLMYVETVAKKAAGRPIKLIIEDTQGAPANAVTKLWKLMNYDKVHVGMGGFLASTGYALSPLFKANRLPFLSPVFSSDDLTQRDFNPYLIRTGWSSSQPAHPLGEYVYRKLGYRKVACCAQDYAFGYECVGGFQQCFEEAGGRIVQKIWPPLGTGDFGPYLKKIKKEADAVFALIVGASPLPFVRQYKEAGLWKKVGPLIGSEPTTDEVVLQQMGDEAVGIISALFYSAAIESAENERFVKTYAKLYNNKVPGYFAESSYVALRVIKEAAEALDGKVEDGDKFLDALKKVELKNPEAPRGPFKFDKYNNPVHNIYIRKVEKLGQKFGVKCSLWNSVIETYPMVSQFWTYDPEKYLKQPPYTRDWPPCKNC
ncbi:MAG: ABC transporter substrate-binding protein [Pseudomonadota bacterium]